MIARWLTSARSHPSRRWELFLPFRASIGVRGAHVTLGHGKVRETVGLPGTGLSYTHVDGTHQEGNSEAQAAAVPDGPRLAAAYAQSVAAGCHVTMKSIFEVLRRPF